MMRITREGLRIWVLAQELQRARASKKLIGEQKEHFREALFGAVRKIERTNKIIKQARDAGIYGEIRDTLISQATDMMMGILDTERPWTVQEICDKYHETILSFFHEILALPKAEDPPKIFDGRTRGDIAKRNWRSKKKQNTEGHVWREGSKKLRAKKGA